MGGCQKYDPVWGTLNIMCRIIMGIQKGTIILTSTYIHRQQIKDAKATSGLSNANKGHSGQALDGSTCHPGWSRI